jgi:uncharacterized protein (TIGR02757 family)
MHPENLNKKLNHLYGRYNKRRYVHPDPLEFLYAYPDVKDREIAGLIASSLAYGRVAQILKSVSIVLEIMGRSPYLFLRDSTKRSLCKTFKGFKHRFADGHQLSALLLGTKNVIDCFGSLNKCFVSGMSKDDDTVIPGMTFFAGRIASGKNNPGHLIAMPEKRSACKRMNLFLRWMVRQDKVDPGGWSDIPLSKLIVPLDTHMHKIGLYLKFTSRKQANMSTALEITSGFRDLVPEDPVKYDFALTRFGIRDDMDINDFINKVKE